MEASSAASTASPQSNSSTINLNGNGNTPQSAAQPTYTGALETNPSDGSNNYKGNHIPNTPLGASVVSVCLAIVFTLGLTLFFRPIALLGGIAHDPSAWTPLGLFMACWAGFHWGEYAVAAGWNRQRCSVDSFLLENGVEYHIANGSAVLEFVITMLLAPQCKTYTRITYLGICLTFLGQYLRSLAMITAASNFSHQIVYKREDSHKLVTNGIYAYLRHPSYTGFFYWALGTQLILQNPVCFIGFGVVVWRFFSRRIPYEEQTLIRFFGDDYRQYRKKVGTWIPFIG